MFARIILLLGLALLLPVPVAAVSDSGDSIVERGPIDDDYYAAGGTIDIDAVVAEDVIVAGGEIEVGHQIGGDLIAAGGSLQIHGRIGDDARIAGGELIIDASIGDDLAASGGSITLTRSSRVGGDAWIAGGEVLMAGTVEQNLKIIGGEIRLSGHVLGDVELEGGDIQILDGAQIDGDLVYLSPQPAVTAAGSRIDGQVLHEPGDPGYDDRGFGLFFSLTLMVASILLYLCFPNYTRAAAARVGSDPWNSLGLGFVVLVATPVAAFILMLLVVGLWVGLSLLAMYAVALLVGFLVGCFFLAELGAGWFKQNLASTARRLIAVIIVIFILGLLQTIPLAGGLLLFLLLLFGLGAGVIQLRYVYRSDSA